jgi:DNA-binding response OmpR family regulator
MMTQTENGSQSLAGVRVLIVEDDPLLLLDLELTLSGAGAEVVGLCQTLQEALRRSDPVDFSVAVLDFRLGSENISPVARRLASQGVPFVFYTGQPPQDSSLAEWRHCSIVEKPSPPHAVISAVKGVLRE